MQLRFRDPSWGIATHMRPQSIKPGAVPVMLVEIRNILRCQ